MADRNEAQMAVLTAITSNAHGVQRKPEDFLVSKSKKSSMAEKVAKLFGGE